MTSYEYASAPRAVSVLPASVSRRLTRRDGLLPLVLALELLAGIAFGVAAHAGSPDATSVPAKLSLGPAVLLTVQPSLIPMASVTAPAPVTGPAIGPLLPGTVRGSLPADVALVTAASPTAYPTHAPRDPFAALVTVKP